jgi:hypothetical protein
MNKNRLYVGHDRIGTYGVLELEDGELRPIEGTERFDEIISDVLERIQERGIGRRIERITGGTIEVDFERLDPADLFYTNAVADALRMEGWRALQLDADRVDAWKLLVTLPFEKEERKSSMDSLPNLSEEALKELLIILKNP